MNINIKWLILALLLLALLAYFSHYIISTYNDSTELKWAEIEKQYEYKAICPQRHGMPFYCNDYSSECGTITLYDAYVFIFGWKEVECYKYPPSTKVTIISIE
jgi:hypothetical protein